MEHPLITPMNSTHKGQSDFLQSTTSTLMPPDRKFRFPPWNLVLQPDPGSLCGYSSHLTSLAVWQVFSVSNSTVAHHTIVAWRINHYSGL